MKYNNDAYQLGLVKVGMCGACLIDKEMLYDSLKFITVFGEMMEKVREEPNIVGLPIRVK